MGCVPTKSTVVAVNDDNDDIGSMISGRIGESRNDEVLIKIIVDPVVKGAFSKFLRQHFAEELLLFLSDCVTLSKWLYDIPQLQLQSLILFEKYIQQSAPMDVHIDHATRENLAEALFGADATKRKQVRCSDGNRILTAFALPREKVFHVLKFEHMCVYLAVPTCGHLYHGEYRLANLARNDPRSPDHA